MTSLIHLVDTPLARALGWTLFHSLWEGALAALILLAAISITRSPRVRYACACLAMLGVLAGFAVTFLRIMPLESGPSLALPRQLPHALPGDQQFPADTPVPFHMADVLPWLTPFWMAGVILFHLRGAAGWMAARHLRRRGVCRAPDAWRRRVDELRGRLRISKPVVLLESALAEVPAVVGYLRPAILVPAGLLAGMPAGQMEAILLHELAHIRRRDYLTNLLQTVVEGFLFYHPAIWWISHVIRNERENCCDDLVVAANGDAREYATALASLEENRWAASQAVLASTGGSLVKRIHRLLYPTKSSALAPFISAAVLMLAAAGAVAAWQAQSPAQTAPDKPMAVAGAYAKWLNEDVVYIIDDRERAAFLSLKTDEERNYFIDQFWQRRDPAARAAGNGQFRDPNAGSPQNAFRTEHYRRIGYANKHFAWQSTPGWKADRGRIYIVYGPPDEIESHPSGRKVGGPSPAVSYPFEEWLYHSIRGVGTNVIMEFDDTAKTGEFRMTQDPHKQPLGGS
jgi:GWxTD domain-containing protein